MFPAKQKGLTMKKTISQKAVIWHDPRFIQPPFNKMVLLCFDNDFQNIFIGYFDASNHWNLLDGIYTGGVEHHLRENLCFPDAWAYFPHNAFLTNYKNKK